MQKLYGFTLEQLKTKSKDSPLVYARQHFWLLLCMEESWSYPRICKISGHDYTTVIYGVRAASREFFGTPKKASLYEMCFAYWNAVGLSEEECHAKAEARAKATRNPIRPGS
jgi:hypothetical protein